MKENKTLVIAMSFAALIIMSVAYAAFANVITITANSTAASTGSVSQTISCGTGTAGLSGATAPTATETTADKVFAVTMYQPGDKIGCTITWKNNTPFTVKTAAGVTGTNCSNITGTVSSPVHITLTNKVAANATLAPGSSTSTVVSVSYFSATAQGQPATLTKSIACSVTWAQA